VVAATLVVMLLALAVRGVDALLHPRSYENVLRDGGMQGLVMLASFLTMLGTGFGFVLACSERATRRMEALASHDDLTGALNRKAAELVLAHGLERARRDEASLAFVLADLDQFKRINDAHGHAMGDEVLRRFVATVRSRLRASDVVARYGGEEFALILPGSDAAGAMSLAEDLRVAVAALRLPPLDGTAGPSLAFTMSAGVAVAERGGLEPAALYRAADRALYRAKHEGRDRVLVASAAEMA
jgi:diguanylate cyclase (GGDEF)-like protein